VIRAVGPSLLPPAHYLTRPLTTWPVLLGKIHDVRVPRGIKPHPVPRPTGAANINILLEMIDRTLAVDGDVAECGVFRGGTLVPMAVYSKQRASAKRLLGFDSFEGFDNAILLDIGMNAPPEPYKRVGAWSHTSASRVLAKLRLFGADNVSLIPGYFRDSLPRCSQRRFSFVHLDIGIYQAYKECLEFFYPRMNPGGIILVNDYNDPPWPGCNKAVDEFLSGKPEKLRLIQIDNYERFYIHKS
jgi:O-methyltransferase